MMARFAAALDITPDEAIIKAVRFDDVGKISILLQAGVDVNSIEPVRGESALMLSIRENAIHACQRLLEHPDIQINARAKNGDTALMLAAFLGRVPMLTILLQAGARVNQPGWTALHYAAAAGYTEAVQRIIRAGAEINARAPNGTTALMMAAHGGYDQVVAQLLEAGADQEQKNDAGWSAADFARQGEFRGLEERLRLPGKHNHERSEAGSE